MFSAVLVLKEPSDGIAAEAECNFVGLSNALLYETLCLVLTLVDGATENPLTLLAKIIMQGTRVAGNRMAVTSSLGNKLV